MLKWGMKTLSLIKIKLIIKEYIIGRINSVNLITGVISVFDVLNSTLFILLDSLAYSALPLLLISLTIFKILLYPHTLLTKLT